jgi:hypothetical protein
MSDLIKHYRQLVGIAKTWALKSLPGWSEECHRDLLQRHGAVEIEGRLSASSLNVPQLDAVLSDYERRGWSRHKRMFGGNPPSTGSGQASTGSGRTDKPRAVPPRIAFMVRAWGKLGMAGKINSSSRQSLLAFCARQVGQDVSDLDSLSVAECQAISEALKAWLAR